MKASPFILLLSIAAVLSTLPAQQRNDKTDRTPGAVIHTELGIPALEAVGLPAGTGGTAATSGTKGSGTPPSIKELVLSLSDRYGMHASIDWGTGRQGGFLYVPFKLAVPFGWYVSPGMDDPEIGTLNREDMRYDAALSVLDALFPKTAVEMMKTGVKKDQKELIVSKIVKAPELIKVLGSSSLVGAFLKEKLRQSALSSNKGTTIAHMPASSAIHP